MKNYFYYTSTFPFSAENALKFAKYSDKISLSDNVDKSDQICQHFFV